MIILTMTVITSVHSEDNDDDIPGAPGGKELGLSILPRPAKS